MFWSSNLSAKNALSLAGFINTADKVFEWQHLKAYDNRSFVKEAATYIADKKAPLKVEERSYSTGWYGHGRDFSPYYNDKTDVCDSCGAWLNFTDVMIGRELEDGNLCYDMIICSTCYRKHEELIDYLDGEVDIVTHKTIKDKSEYGESKLSHSVTCSCRMCTQPDVSDEVVEKIAIENLTGDFVLHKEKNND